MKPNEELEALTELEALKEKLRKQLQGSGKRTATFVHFNTYHLQLDLSGFLKSEEGKKSLDTVVNLSKKMPTLPIAQEKDQPLAAAG